MENYRRFLKQLRDERGVVVIVVAITAILLLSLVAFAIDIGYAMLTRNELQNVADASALAASRELGVFYEGMSYEQQQVYDCTGDDEAKIIQAAKDVAEKNRAAGKNITINSDDITIGNWNANTRTLNPTLNGPDAVKVRARRDNITNGPITTFFAHILGQDTLSISTKATAALTGESTAEAGGLPLPVGISAYWFTLYEETGYCNKPIKLHPTNTIEGCAGWHTYMDTPANAAKLRQLLKDLKDGRFTSPNTVAGVDEFVFIGGDVASDFSDIKALFDYMKGLNDGVLDADEDPNTWTTAVPVYEWDNCDNPNKAIKILGFAMVTIMDVLLAPEKTVDAVVKCDGIRFGRGGGGEYGTKGSIPGLVE